MSKETKTIRQYNYTDEQLLEAMEKADKLDEVVGALLAIKGVITEFSKQYGVKEAESPFVSIIDFTLAIARRKMWVTKGASGE